MRSLNKRVSTLEDRNNIKAKPAAHIMIKRTDGTATVRLPNGTGKKKFESDRAARSFLNKQDTQGLPPIEVIIIDSQGKMPEVS